MLENKMNTDEPTTAIEKTPSGSAPSRPVLTIDYALYEEHLEGADLSETQKQEFLDALWSIIVAFVDLGFGVHPLQQAKKDGVDGCGRKDDLARIAAGDMLSLSGKIPQNQFAQAADPDTGSALEKES